MAFSPQFLDEIRARLTLSDIIGRSVKRDGVANTPAAHNRRRRPLPLSPDTLGTVSDDKNFYHCFGCGAHGDVISFVIENDGLSFPEAVERLAADGDGAEVLASTPQGAAANSASAELVDVVEAACSIVL